MSSWDSLCDSWNRAANTEIDELDDHEEERSSCKVCNADVELMLHQNTVNISRLNQRV